MAEYFVEEVIQHHGILGQKWGIRRYQNKDGSLTSEGKKRAKSLYDGDTSVKKKRYDKKILEAYEKVRPLSDEEKDYIVKNGKVNKAITRMDQFTLEELKTMETRRKQEDNIDALAKKENHKTRDLMNEKAADLDALDKFVTSGTKAYNSVAKVLNALGAGNLKLIDTRSADQVKKDEAEAKAKAEKAAKENKDSGDNNNNNNNNNNNKPPKNPKKPKKNNTTEEDKPEEDKPENDKPTNGKPSNNNKPAEDNKSTDQESSNKKNEDDSRRVEQELIVWNGKVTQEHAKQESERQAREESERKAREEKEIQDYSDAISKHIDSMVDSWSNKSANDDDVVYYTSAGKTYVIDLDLDDEDNW